MDSNWRGRVFERSVRRHVCGRQHAHSDFATIPEVAGVCESLGHANIEERQKQASLVLWHTAYKTHLRSPIQIHCMPHGVSNVQLVTRAFVRLPMILVQFYV